MLPLYKNPFSNFAQKAERCLGLADLPNTRIFDDYAILPELRP
jgi:hypothetical protein